MYSPKVTVIIPVYNEELYLRKCLNSLINQTLQEIEIICIDDGSTDNSLSILQEYAKKDTRIVVLSQPNSNAGVARNHGLKYATGEYLSFLDADDFFELDMLEVAYSHAKREDAEIVVFYSDLFNMEQNSFEPRTTVIEENLPDFTPFPGLKVKKDLFKTFVGWAWDKLFLREYVTTNAYQFQEQRTTNDLLFTYLALAKSERIALVKRVLIHHRINVKTSLESTRFLSWDCFFLALKALKEELIKSGLYTHYEQDFINYSLNFSLWNLYTLPWPTQELLYYTLKLVWFKELGVDEKDEAYFYNKDEYFLLQKILFAPYYETSPVSMKQELDRKESELKAQNHIISEQKEELNSVYNSLSYKIGRLLTYVPRIIRDMICRFNV